MIDRRQFISKTAAATAGLAATLPRDSYAQRSPNDTINVAIIGLRGDNKGHPTWTARGRASTMTSTCPESRTSALPMWSTSTSATSRRRCPSQRSAGARRRRPGAGVPGPQERARPGDHGRGEGRLRPDPLSELHRHHAIAEGRGPARAARRRPSLDDFVPPREHRVSGRTIGEVRRHNRALRRGFGSGRAIGAHVSRAVRAAGQNLARSPS